VQTKKYILIVLFLVSGLYANTFDIAYIKESGQDMIIIPVNSNFMSKDHKTQQMIYTDLEVCAHAAHLKGNVMVVAEQSGRFSFYGPKQWESFFKDLNMNWVKARINKKLACH